MATKDKTFVAFTAAQAEQYATGRGFSYPPELYQAILDYHDGPHDLLLDVGTGPGKVVFDMLPSFNHAVGCDTSVGMVEQAKKGADQRGMDDKTTFIVCGGETCENAVPEEKKGQVDVLTIAMAAHWLEIEKFYKSAANVLRPGGTLAMWTCSSLYCHPSTPNAAAVQAAFDDCENRMLLPYHTPGNIMSRSAYDTLPLPWTLESTMDRFDKSSFFRKDWDRGGVPSSPPDPDSGSPGPFLRHKETNLSDLQRAMATSSSVIRFRDDYPEQAHTEDDPIVLTMSKVQRLLGGKDSLVVSPSIHLLLMRKV